MEWTNELIFDFLNLYQNEPSLWNVALPEHKNKNDAYDAWNRIKHKLKDGNIPIKELKKKRDNLMSTYRRQRTKVKNSMETDSGTHEACEYKPEWPFYNRMAIFLDNVYNPKKTKSLVDLLDTEDIDDNTSLDDENDEGTFKIPKTLPKRTSIKSKLHESDEVKKRMDEAYDFFQKVSQKPDPDTCSLYCDLLCNKLRALKESTQDIAMLEIDRLMYNLKQQENQAIGSQYQNATFHSAVLPYSQKSLLPNYQATTGYQNSCISQPSSPLHQHSPASPAYSHSSNSQTSPHYQEVSLSPLSDSKPFIGDQ